MDGKTYLQSIKAEERDLRKRSPEHDLSGSQPRQGVSIHVELSRKVACTRAGMTDIYAVSQRDHVPNQEELRSCDAQHVLATPTRFSPVEFNHQLNLMLYWTA